jgi:uncharacterized membrane protein YfcA
MPTDLLWLVIGIIFVAAFVRSALGFGEAVLGMPLLAMTVGLRTAAPLIAFIGPTISILILARHWRRVEFGPARRLIAATFLGIPVGIYGLARLPEAPLKLVLGIVILLYGIFGLAKPGTRLVGEKKGLTWFVGWIAGVLGGAYNTNGPPIAAYGMLRGWSPDSFRATLQGYFLPTGLAVLAGHGLAGLWTATVLKFYAYAFPAVVGGVVLGGLLNKKLPHSTFTRLVYIGLAVMGTVMLIRTIW